jgi:hypothetical protein
MGQLGIGWFRAQPRQGNDRASEVRDEHQTLMRNQQCQSQEPEPVPVGEAKPMRRERGASLVSTLGTRLELGHTSQAPADAEAAVSKPRGPATLTSTPATCTSGLCHVQ